MIGFLCPQKLIVLIVLFNCLNLIVKLIGKKLMDFTVIAIDYCLMAFQYIIITGTRNKIIRCLKCRVKVAVILKLIPMEIGIGFLNELLIPRITI